MRGGKLNQQQTGGRNKRDKFVELAEKRTQRVLDSIDSLSNLATPSNYDYTAKDYDKIIRTIRRSINQMQARFEGKDQEKKGFRL